jgi:hypothetical protein
MENGFTVADRRPPVIACLDFPDFQVSDPPTRAGVLAIVNYLGDLHAALQRE